MQTHANTHIQTQGRRPMHDRRRKSILLPAQAMIAAATASAAAVAEHDAADPGWKQEHVVDRQAARKIRPPRPEMDAVFEQPALRSLHERLNDQQAEDDLQARNRARHDSTPAERRMLGPESLQELLHSEPGERSRAIAAHWTETMASSSNPYAGMQPTQEPISLDAMAGFVRTTMEGVQHTAGQQAAVAASVGSEARRTDEATVPEGNSLSETEQTNVLNTEDYLRQEVKEAAQAHLENSTGNVSNTEAVQALAAATAPTNQSHLPPDDDISINTIRAMPRGGLSNSAETYNLRKNFESCENFRRNKFVSVRGRVSGLAAPKRARLRGAGTKEEMLELLAERQREASHERVTASRRNEMSYFLLWCSFTIMLGKSPYRLALAGQPAPWVVNAEDQLLKSFVLYLSLHYTSHQALKNCLSAVRTVHFRLVNVIIPYQMPYTDRMVREVRTLMYNEAGARRDRHPFMPHHFRAIAAHWTETIGMFKARGMTMQAKLLANALVLLAACRAKAMRPGEVSPAEGWSKLTHWSRSSVKFLRKLKHKQYAMVSPPEACKTMHGRNGVQRQMGMRPFPFVCDETDPSSFPMALILQHEIDPVSAEEEEDTPLARNPATNEPLSMRVFGLLVEAAHAACFPAEPALKITAYSIKLGAVLAFKFAGATHEMRQWFANWSTGQERFSMQGVYNDQEEKAIVEVLMRMHSTETFAPLSLATENVAITVPTTAAGQNTVTVTRVARPSPAVTRSLMGATTMQGLMRTQRSLLNARARAANSVPKPQATKTRAGGAAASKQSGAAGSAIAAMFAAQGGGPVPTTHTDVASSPAAPRSRVMLETESFQLQAAREAAEAGEAEGRHSVGAQAAAAAQMSEASETLTNAMSSGVDATQGAGTAGAEAPARQWEAATAASGDGAEDYQMDAMHSLLVAAGCEQYEDVLRENDFDLEALEESCLDDLQQVGVPAEAENKILQMVEKRYPRQQREQGPTLRDRVAKAADLARQQAEQANLARQQAEQTEQASLARQPTAQDGGEAEGACAGAAVSPSAALMEPLSQEALKSTYAEAYAIASSNSDVDDDYMDEGMLYEHGPGSEPDCEQEEVLVRGTPETHLAGGSPSTADTDVSIQLGQGRPAETESSPLVTSQQSQDRERQQANRSLLDLQAGVEGGGHSDDDQDGGMTMSPNDTDVFHGHSFLDDSQPDECFGPVAGLRLAAGAEGMDALSQDRVLPVGSTRQRRNQGEECVNMQDQRAHFHAGGLASARTEPSSEEPQPKKRGPVAGAARRKALEEGAKGTKSLATMWARPAAVAKRRSSDGAAAPTAAKVAKVASGQPTFGATPDQGAPQSKPVGKKNKLRLRRSRWGKSAEDVAREKRAQAEEEEEVEQLEDVAATTESDAGDGPAEPGASSDSE